MNLPEAYEAAKQGKRVADAEGDIAIISNGRLVWEEDRSVVTVRAELINGWEVVKEPAKEYNFAEAFEMMKKGTWMVPPDYDLQAPMALVYGDWIIKSPSRKLVCVDIRLFSQDMIEGKWTEYKP